MSAGQPSPSQGVSSQLSRRAEDGRPELSSTASHAGHDIEHCHVVLPAELERQRLTLTQSAFTTMRPQIAVAAVRARC